MSLWGRIRSTCTKSLEESYIDLTAIVFLTLTTIVVTQTPVINETPIRPVVGLTFILLAPGWALVASLFPRASRTIDFNDLPDGLPFSGDELRDLVAEETELSTDISTISGSPDPNLTGVERLAVSIGVGVALVALAGVALNYTPWPIALGPVLATLSSITLVCTAVGAVRRSRVPAFERFRVPLHSLRKHSSESWTVKNHVLNVAVVLSALLLVGTMAFTLTVPAPDDRFTNFWVLTEDETGDLTAGNYTDALEADAERDLVVGIENNEYEDVLYVVVVQLQAIERTDNGIHVADRQEIDRFRQYVESNETWQQNHEIIPENDDGEGRIQYLLYKIESPYTDTVPDEPTAENADNELHLWLNNEPNDDTLSED